MNETVNRDKTRTRLNKLPTRDLLWLRRKVQKELNRRAEEHKALKERVEGMYPAMMNFMSGVAHALACRASLRRAHDHYPEGGVRPASGEMWLPIEMLKACRLDIKERGWSPLTASAFIPQQRNWYSRGKSAKELDEELGIRAVQFKIPFASETVGRRIESAG